MSRCQKPRRAESVKAPPLFSGAPRKFADDWKGFGMSSGRSYRAVLPALSDAELRRLKAWGQAHCAVSVFFRDGGKHCADCIVWLATRERPRPREAFMRSIRATLKKLDIDPSPLRGTWLVLASDDVVFQESRATRTADTEASQPSRLASISSPRLSKPSNKAASPPPAPQGDGDDKVIHLMSSAGARSARSSVQVVKV